MDVWKFIYLCNNFGKMWTSRRNFWDPSAVPSEIKREWLKQIEKVVKIEKRIAETYVKFCIALLSHHNNERI
jgi:hypothetical protein